MRLFIAGSMLAFAVVSVTAQEPQKPLAVIEPSDIAELNHIVDEQMPPKWSRPIAEWVNKLLERQKSREKAEADNKSSSK